MAIQFTKATKKQARLRLALIGPSGSGKTYSALAIGTRLVKGGRVAVIDTERGSASKYAGLFEFDTLELDTFSPQIYVQAIQAADAAGYDVLIIDSLSHAWMGKGGALEQVDQVAKRSNSQNSFTAWREVTPHHNAMINAILQCKAHVIVTMRAKTEYVMEVNEKGKNTPRKVGLAPIQRDGVEYEFDLVADMSLENDLIVSKSRCPQLSGAVVNKPGAEVAQTLAAWLTDGAEAPEPPAETTTPAPGNSEGPAKALRPLAPDSLKNFLEKKAAKHTGTATEAQRNLVAMLLTAALDGSEQRRRDVQKWLTGHSSLKEMENGMILALLDWLDPQTDTGGAYYPSFYAAREANLVLVEAAKANGQQLELPAEGGAQ